MFRSLISGLALAALLGGAASAEVFEVHMLNKSDNGTMVFEPDLVQIAPGDTVKFIPTDKAHNAESVDGMIPAGAEAFKGKINQELDVTFDAEGVYAVKCNPHFAMGMVMTIKVGDAAAPDDFLAGRLPKKAKERFETQLGKL
ncbi:MULTISPECIES: pseudoazurin [Roseobacteraceae]|jgi:pseudoazurin|uniref:Pseudoazurin n=1 Tax=Celeribacter baekdonensis B30 TaxID=1208323 RepID=K2IV58_9RHOB|nr:MULTISPECIES: pseudoazurin [Roseobacteraceae]EKE74231.1 blue (type 1) copper subtype protein [Celeribacter baekdonensis B30]KAB6716765.1 pseudoazurin [Roseobacter sp. TSBP12]|tara:strand:+ start:14426 stop:14854 length:429 start_codon:yes stop_codon:yes gene_type:complete